MRSLIEQINGMFEEQKAQALLIAVEALEKIEAKSWNDEYGFSDIANDALSRIRPLPIT